MKRKPVSEFKLAEALSKRLHGEAAYCPKAGRWATFDGEVWVYTHGEFALAVMARSRDEGWLPKVPARLSDIRAALRLLSANRKMHLGAAPVVATVTVASSPYTTTSCIGRDYCCVEATTSSGYPVRLLAFRDDAPSAFSAISPAIVGSVLRVVGPCILNAEWKSTTIEAVSAALLSAPASTQLSPRVIVPTVSEVGHA